MKLYTKTGDEGETGLIGGTRVPKNHIRLEAYGTVDELNSFIGLLTTFQIDNSDLLFLQSIQNKLFIIGSYLATDFSKYSKTKVSPLLEKDITNIETEIDRLTSEVPALNNFVLPGGSQASALCHICRTITRRLERRLYDLHEQIPVDKNILIFINRMSDYFFALSRYLLFKNNIQEILWQKNEEND